VLGFAAGYATLSSAIMMMVPAIRSCQWKHSPDQ
jgi:hypothetical protein